MRRRKGRWTGMTAWLTWQAWGELLHFDLVKLRGFRALHELVLKTPVRPAATTPDSAAIAATVQAMETASRRYPKRAQCLQRSTVVTGMLRKQGIEAELVIGCHLAPLRAHAWVEVSGDVVSDALDDLPYFCIVDRW